MSGIEIAGLVLGAFPLLIHALESYREGAEVLLDWWRIQRAYKKCKQDLNYHKILFEGNLERFLLPLVVDDDELKTLMADPAGSGWENPDLETRLKDRLPRSYELYLDIVGDINELMESLKKELGVHNPNFQARVDSDGKLIKTNNASRKDLIGMTNIEFQAKRIRFSLKKSSRERLFAKLQDLNDRMRNLLESNDHIAAARQSRQVAKPPSIVNRKIKEFWRHAQRLHEALSKAWQWQCSCASHVANLHLEHRTSDKIEFDILFNVGTGNDAHGVWQETKIKMIKEDLRSSQTSVALSVPESVGGGPRRQVRWMDTDSQETLQSPEHDNAPEIRDLCSTLSTKCANCIGFLNEDEHRFVIYKGHHTTAINNLSTVTLSDLFSDAHTLTRRKRYCLALTLASSFLQLGATSWLNSPLMKENIIFLRDSSDPSSTLLEHPYIKREISQRPASAPAEAISSLGIRLLELCFGAPLETNIFRQKLPAGDAASSHILDYAAAIQWSRMASEEAGPEFAEAIEWCLHAKELSDGRWREDLWKHVIVPLNTCHQQVSKKTVAV